MYVWYKKESGREEKKRERAIEDQKELVEEDWLSKPPSLWLKDSLIKHTPHTHNSQFISSSLLSFHFPFPFSLFLSLSLSLSLRSISLWSRSISSIPALFVPFLVSIGIVRSSFLCWGMLRCRIPLLSKLFFLY